MVKILGLGHSDTVWPLGTLKSMPFRRQRPLWGPGVLDMKAGLGLFHLCSSGAARIRLSGPAASGVAGGFG